MSKVTVQSAGTDALRRNDQTYFPSLDIIEMLARKLILAAAVVSSAHSTCVAGLIHHWAFDEAVGTTAFDSAGGLTGSLINMDGSERSSDTPFGNGRSLVFDASNNEHIDFGSDFVQLNSDSDFSVSFWYKGTQVSQRHAWGAFGFAAWEASGISASLSLQSGRVLYSHFDGAWRTNITSSSSIVDDEWHHVALVNYSNQTADLWIDGNRELSGVSSAISGTLQFQIHHLMRGHGSPDGYISGQLDDFRIYDHSLTSSDVANLSSVPEPSCLALLATLAMGVSWRRRRTAADRLTQ